MALQLDWAIDILPSPSGAGAVFRPKLVPPANPGDPLKAQPLDIVTWGNRTTETHQPWPTVGNLASGDPAQMPATGNPLGYLCDPIAPNDSSRPQFVVTGAAGTKINYCCRFHPTERGQIIIVTF
jgi:hypothetical protein